MLIGSLQVELHLPACHSLKEKRFTLQGLKTRLRNRFNVSVAEVDYQDKWQRSVVGVACISNDRKHIDEMLQKVLRNIENEPETEVIGQLIEVF